MSSVLLNAANAREWVLLGEDSFLPLFEDRMEQLEMENS